MSKSQFRKKRKKKEKKGKKEKKKKNKENSAWLSLALASKQLVLWYAGFNGGGGYEMRVPWLEQMEVVPMEVSMDLVAVDLAQRVRPLAMLPICYVVVKKDRLLTN